MPRSVYYQSAGNPIQHDKVPAEPLELEFVYHRSVDNDDKAHTRQVLKDAVIASFMGLLLFWLQTLLFDFTILPIFVLGILVLIAWRVVESQLDTMPGVILATLIAAWIYCLIPLPNTLEVFVALTSSTYLAREIIRQYTFLSTVAPASMRTAWKIREAVCWQTIASSLVLLPVAIGFVMPQIMPTMLLVGGFSWGLLILLYVNKPHDYAEKFWDAIRSWCSYNRQEQCIAGILLSPAGTCKQRIGLLIAVVLLNTCILFKIFFLPLVSGSEMHIGLLAATENVTALVLHFLIAVALSGVAAILPLSMIMAVICVVGTPVLGRFSIPKPSVAPAGEWKEITSRIRQSSNKVERNSIYQGRVSFDQSPMLVPTEVFREHAHFLGDSGSGKTARGLAPFIEQVLATGEASVMGLDLKGDSQELLQTIRSGASTAKELYDVDIPIRFFSLRGDQATYGFNPLRLPSWHKLDDLQKTDILCGALGLIYGSDYGEGYYSSANASVLYATVRHFPEISSFEELAEKIGYVIARPKAHGIDEKSRDAGNHVKMTVTRLASIAALNIDEKSTPSDEVLENCIDPSRLFQAPEAHYYSMSATLGPGSSPEVGRLATYMLMMTSSLTERKVPVYLIIDEFQRMASRNLDYLLQLARSMGIAVILANQSMQDLQRYDLVSVLETNCRYRQWFAISGWDDQERLSHHSGETVDVLNGESVSSSSNSKGTTTSSSYSTNEFIGPRLTRNDIKLVSDDDRKSIVLINRGAGYAQYGGMPVVIESDFHISKDEYELRKNAPWPTDETGTFVPDEWERPKSKTNRRGRTTSSTPTITQETITAKKNVAGSSTKAKKSRRKKSKQSQASLKVKGNTETSNAFEQYLRENPLESATEPAIDSEGN